ncbi:MAG: hypothetical protein ABIZ80_02520, partial [Bryobacteraceae bacterium]
VTRKQETEDTQVVTQAEVNKEPAPQPENTQVTPAAPAAPIEVAAAPPERQQSEPLAETRTEQVVQADRTKMPETSSNWTNLLLSGGLLIGVGLVLRQLSPSR